MTIEHAERDHRLNRRGSILNYIVAALQAAQLLFHVFAARKFGAEAYGSYRWAWAVMEVAQQVGLWGVHQAVLRGVAASEATHDADARHHAVRTGTAAVLAWSGLTTLACLVAPVVLAWLAVPEEAWAALRWLSLMLPIWSAMMVWVSATMGTRSMTGNLIARGVTFPLALNLALLAIAIVWPLGGARAISLAHVIGMAASLVAAAAAYRRAFHEAPSIEWRPSRWEPRVLRFAVPVGAAETVNQALTRVDMVLLGLLWPDPFALATYGAAMLLSEGASGSRYAMDPLVSASVAASHASGDRARLTRNLRQMVTWASALAVPISIVLLVWGDGLLMLWGREYVAARWVLVVLVLAHAVNASIGLHQWVIVMSGRPTLDAVNNVAALIAGGLVCAVAIPRLGPLGAALGSLMAMATLRGAQVVQGLWLEGVHGLSWTWLKIMIVGVASAIVQAAIRYVWGLGIASGVIGTAVGVTLYVVLYRRWALRDADARPPEPAAREELRDDLLRDALPPRDDSPREASPRGGAGDGR